MAIESDWFKLGQAVRRSLVAAQGGNGSGLGTRAGEVVTPGLYGSHRAQDEAVGVAGLFNQAARLRSGHLLVVHLGRNACFQVDPESGAAEYLFSLTHAQTPFLWRVLADRKRRVYCTLSGMRDQASPTQDAAFGLAGAVLELNTRLATIRAVATGDALVDPCGMHIVDDTRLLVSDFAGFGASGSIYTVDRLTGRITPLAQGGLLREPVSALLDDDGVLWVANSYMHYTYPQRGGEIEKDDGELLRIDPDGRQTIVVERESPAQGSIVGIHRAHDPEHVIAIKGDWPTMQTGAVLLVDKRSGEVETLLSASLEDPRFYSTHVDLAGDVLWVGESYEKEILGYDLGQRKVTKRIDFGAVMGGWLGVGSSFEGIESVSVVPELDEPE